MVLKEVMAAVVTPAVVTTAVQPMEMRAVRATAVATAVCRALDAEMPADPAVTDPVMDLE